MKILFALMLHTHVYYGDVWTRIGVYERWTQCVAQAGALKRMKEFDEADTYAVCLATNG